MGKPHFINSLEVTALRQGGYRLTTSLRYKTNIPEPHVVTVPAGFVTDLASIPRVFRWLFTGHGKSRYPSVVHDYLYEIRHDRGEADRIFREALEVAGAGWLKRNVMYAAVRAGGWKAYL